MMAIMVTIIEADKTNDIPPKASDIPEKTEVRAKETPIVVPNIPLALAIFSSGTINGMSVGTELW